jgi:hypothetical protein
MGQLKFISPSNVLSLKVPRVGKGERAPAAKANTYRPGDIEPPLPLTPELAGRRRFAGVADRSSGAGSSVRRPSLGCPYAIDRASVGDTQANPSSRRCRISPKPYTRRFLARPDRSPMVKARDASACRKPHAFGRVRDCASSALSA